MFNVLERDSTGTGDLAWHLADAEPASATVSKVSRVHHCLLLQSMLSLHTGAATCNHLKDEAERGSGREKMRQRERERERKMRQRAGAGEKDEAEREGEGEGEEEGAIQNQN